VRFLDTNIILRYLTRDDEAKAAACLELLQRVSSDEERVTSSETVFAEVVYVLASKKHYALPPDAIRARVGPILNLRGLRMPGKAALLRALDVYAAYPGLDIEDALSVAHMERQGVVGILSYDTGFDQIDVIQRYEP
jgi:predicted nucleic acid-binding protein